MEQIILGVVGVAAILIVVFGGFFAPGGKPRRGGGNGNVNWLPSSWARKSNDEYRARGWPEPYDDESDPRV
ncbi:hypothetical protein CLV35_0246 [Motilibacter peucedani]|uniref:Uncharacterized protein n=1 Tax=Motilibacter peucedani TaxID=598650 RepID=A0A420XV59_9ACTN|nr:hypothetical protein [Motilibacter peucedani]RKS80657.1 hypothetical protein CLV35_0246 [Motilibacter peucedani]